MGEKIINISGLVGSNKKEFIYNESEKEVLKKVIDLEKEDLSSISSYADKEDLSFLKKASTSLSLIYNKINLSEYDFSFKELDFLLGACVESYQKSLDSNELSTYELIILRNIVGKLSVVYNSFNENKDNKRKDMEF